MFTDNFAGLFKTHILSSVLGSVNLFSSWYWWSDKVEIFVAPDKREAILYT